MNTPVVTRAQMLSDHVAREPEMKGSDLAFLDQRIPAHKREIINVIDMSVVENVEDPALVPKIAAPAHGFSVGYIRAKKGCGAALHAGRNQAEVRAVDQGRRRQLEGFE